jgi:hypothetical protein
MQDPRANAGTLVRIALALVACLAAAAPAMASQPDDCPTWFPDFRCKRSGRFEGFQKPIVQPYLFEDPFITTGAYPYYLWHEFPDDSIFQGGHADAFALQLRVALTDRLAFIATKDGRMRLDPDLVLLDDSEGWMNLAGGFKYALIQRPEDQFILSAALRAEAPTGSDAVFAGGSEVIVLPSVSAAWGLEDLHLIGGLGGQIPTDSNEYSTSGFYHLYVDYAVASWFQPFVQISGMHWFDGGDGHRRVELANGAVVTIDQATHAVGVGHFEGADVLNLGSKGVEGQDLVTAAIGTHIPLGKHLAFSVAYERPITERKGIFEQRLTTALRIEF